MASKNTAHVIQPPELPEDEEKLTSVTPDTSDIDSDWGDAPNSEKVSLDDSKPAGTDSFEYVDPAKIRSEVGQAVEEGINGKELSFGAEDTLGTGIDHLSKVFKKEDREFPSGLIFVGGEESPYYMSNQFLPSSRKAYLPESDLSEFEERMNSINLYCTSDCADHPYNRDALAAYFDEKTQSINLCLASAQDLDPISSNIANAAAMKAAYEFTTHTDTTMEEVSERALENAKSVIEEFGEGEKSIDLTTAQINGAMDPNEFTLQISNFGNNRCLVLSPEDNSTVVGKNGTSLHSGQIVLLANSDFLQALDMSESEVGNFFLEKLDEDLSINRAANELIRTARANGSDSSASLMVCRLPIEIDSSAIDRRKEEDSFAYTEAESDIGASAIVDPMDASHERDEKKMVEELENHLANDVSAEDARNAETAQIEKDHVGPAIVRPDALPEKKDDAAPYGDKFFGLDKSVPYDDKFFGLDKKDKPDTDKIEKKDENAA